MDLQEEYFRRRALKAHFIKYVERGNLILRAKANSPKKAEWNWLHMTLSYHQDPNHPGHFNFVLAANPVIYASQDFAHFTHHPAKVVKEERWEWDAYEDNIKHLVSQYCESYEAISSQDAVFVSWELFATNYDAWMANFLPSRVSDWLCKTLDESEREKRLEYIKLVEDWLREKYDRVFGCWKSIRQNLDQKTYADWLAKIVNSATEPTIRPYSERDLVALA